MSCCGQVAQSSGTRHAVVTRKSYIEIDPKMTAKTYLKFSGSGCNAPQMLLNDNCVYIDIKRVGSDVVLARYNSYDIDVDGSISFYWDNCLFCVAPGYYTGEVFVDCDCDCSCDCAHEKIATVFFVKKRKMAAVSAVRSIPAAEYCPPKCPEKECCDGAIPSSM